MDTKGPRSYWSRGFDSGWNDYRDGGLNISCFKIEPNKIMKEGVSSVDSPKRLNQPESPLHLCQYKTAGCPNDKASCSTYLKREDFHTVASSATPVLILST